MTFRQPSSKSTYVYTGNNIGYLKTGTGNFWYVPLPSFSRATGIVNKFKSLYFLGGFSRMDPWRSLKCFFPLHRSWIWGRFCLIKIWAKPVFVAIDDGFELGRTEMGLYYSYFKTIVEADSLPTGVYQLYRKMTS
jgi:hypothetical protein